MLEATACERLNIVFIEQGIDYRFVNNLSTRPTDSQVTGENVHAVVQAASLAASRCSHCLPASLSAGLCRWLPYLQKGFSWSLRRCGDMMYLTCA